MVRKAAPVLMPTSLTGNRHGFTLLELLVVLFIMAVMSAVVAASIGPAVAEARLRAATSMMVAQLQYARSYAVISCAPAAVLFDATHHGVTVISATQDTSGSTTWQTVTTQAGRFRPLPDGIVITDISLDDAQLEALTPDAANPFTEAPIITGVTTSDGTTEDGQYITFTPLGQGEDATITLQDANGKLRIIQVDAITGRCEITTNVNGQPSN